MGRADMCTDNPLQLQDQESHAGGERKAYV